MPKKRSTAHRDSDSHCVSRCDMVFEETTSEATERMLPGRRMPAKRRACSKNLADVDLGSIHKKITNECYWSSNAWMEMMANSLFSDHNYCLQPETKNNTSTSEKSTESNHSPPENAKNNKPAILDLTDLSIQSVVEIPYAKESRCATKSSESSASSAESPNFDGSPAFQERRSSLFSVATPDDSGIESCDSTLTENEDIIMDSIGEILQRANNIRLAEDHCYTTLFEDASEIRDLIDDGDALGDTCTFLENSKLLENDGSTAEDAPTLQRGEQVEEKSISEENLKRAENYGPSAEDASVLKRDEHAKERSTFAENLKRAGNQEPSPGDASMLEREKQVEERIFEENSKRPEYDESSAEDAPPPEKNEPAEYEELNISKETRPKRSYVIRKNREVIVSEESPVIEGEFEGTRRVTRLLVKNSGDKPAKTVDSTPGKLVWGYFRTGWWPAIIIKAEDVGMISTPGKIWVWWIGDSRISELRDTSTEPFSDKLELRLNNLATNAKTKVTCKKQKEDACFRIIQLLKSHFPGGALIRPYTSWIRNHILPHANKLDGLLFYPYPESLANKLSDLRKVNFDKTEKYLRQQEKERLSKAAEAKNPTRKAEKPEKPVEEGGINIMDQKPGMIVWAKMQGYSLWPCVIMNYQHLNRKQPNVAHQWVMWYGDYKYSQVEYRQILTFPTGMERMEAKITTTKDDLFIKAVLLASMDYCEQLGYLPLNWKINNVIQFFYKSKDRFKLKNAPLIETTDDNPYSQTIQKQLRKQVKNQPVSEERKALILRCKNLKLVHKKELSLDSLCVTCFESSEELEEHPIFYASLCEQCSEEFRPKMFAYGNDGKCFFCTLCGGDDLVAMCDNINCPRVFCTACIKYIVCPDFYEEILLKHPWHCFLCDPTSEVLKDSLLKIRKDWRNRMISIYRVDCDDDMRSNFERFDRKKKIRVLSLFDGIGTGLVVLKKLNINIECYYASEIDPDSMQVSFFNHGHDQVIQLGDVRNIDEKKIKEIAPIDLLIGGSPCNELSLANPKRRGLDDPEGTGVLFYDYCRIKKLVLKHNKKRHLFWLFENVASMPKKYRTQISENLDREPKFLDSADFSAQHRPRLYWGNLPWGPYQVNDVVLQDVLRKRCNRQALVKKIMTVTTRSNSLNQTKENLKPVLMDGKKDMLWVTELEEIFGFPIHYTDANLQKTRRLQLIGKAWSVQTLTAIFRPLFYF